MVASCIERRDLGRLVSIASRCIRFVLVSATCSRHRRRSRILNACRCFPRPREASGKRPGPNEPRGYNRPDSCRRHSGVGRIRTPIPQPWRSIITRSDRSGDVLSSGPSGLLLCSSSRNRAGRQNDELLPLGNRRGGDSHERSRHRRISSVDVVSRLRNPAISVTDNRICLGGSSSASPTHGRDNQTGDHRNRDHHALATYFHDARSTRSPRGNCRENCCDGRRPLCNSAWTTVLSHYRARDDPVRWDGACPRTRRQNRTYPRTRSCISCFLVGWPGSIRVRTLCRRGPT